jgi:hypothetical protein
MNIYQFMSDSPWLTFFLVFLLTATVSRIWNRFWRHMNIRKHGYPPPHCNADGDFKEDQ